MRRVLTDDGSLRTFTLLLALRSVVGLTGGVAVATAVGALDRWMGLAVPLSPDAARALLVGFVGGVLTVAVFALWMRTVVVGLASGQVSARIVAAYLDDPFQQRVLGVMVALLGYLVTVTVQLPTEGTTTPLASTAMSLAVVVAALIGVLLAMRDAVSSLSMPSVIRTLTDHVLALLQDEPVPNDPLPARALPGPSDRVLRSRQLGWVQDIDHDRLLGALPDGATCALQATIGEFVAHGERIAHLDAEVDEDTLAELRGAFAIERVRSSRHDLAYAIQQLLDVAEHAMAPHSPDTSTAHEALVHLRGVLHALIRRGTASGCRLGQNGTAVVSTTAWSTVDHLEQVFARLRQAATEGWFGREVDRTIDALTRTAEEVGDDDSLACLRRLREPA